MFLRQQAIIAQQDQEIENLRWTLAVANNEIQQLQFALACAQNEVDHLAATGEPRRDNTPGKQPG